MLEFFLFYLPFFCFSSMAKETNVDGEIENHQRSKLRERRLNKNECEKLGCKTICSIAFHSVIFLKISFFGSYFKYFLVFYFNRWNVFFSPFLFVMKNSDVSFFCSSKTREFGCSSQNGFVREFVCGVPFFGFIWFIVRLPFNDPSVLKFWEIHLSLVAALSISKAHQIISINISRVHFFRRVHFFIRQLIANIYTHCLCRARSRLSGRMKRIGYYGTAPKKWLNVYAVLKIHQLQQGPIIDGDGCALRNVRSNTKYIRV